MRRGKTDAGRKRRQRMHARTGQAMHHARRTASSPPSTHLAWSNESKSPLCVHGYFGNSAASEARTTVPVAAACTEGARACMQQCAKANASVRVRRRLHMHVRIAVRRRVIRRAGGWGGRSSAAAVRSARGACALSPLSLTMVAPASAPLATVANRWLCARRCVRRANMVDVTATSGAAAARRERSGGGQRARYIQASMAHACVHTSRSAHEHTRSRSPLADDAPMHGRRTRVDGV
jgi:hypothetical protein